MSKLKQTQTIKKQKPWGNKVGVGKALSAGDSGAVGGICEGCHSPGMTPELLQESPVPRGPNPDHRVGSRSPEDSLAEDSMLQIRLVMSRSHYNWLILGGLSKTVPGWMLGRTSIEANGEYKIHQP